MLSSEAIEVEERLGERKSIVFSWGDLREKAEADSDPSGTLVTGWDRLTIHSRLFDEVEGVDRVNTQKLVDAAIAYYQGNYEQACKIVGPLIDSEDLAVIMPAHMVRMISSVASARCDDAYQEFVTLKALCEEGLRHPEDPSRYSSSVLCALYVEAVVMATIFDLPPMDAGIDFVPSRLRVYYGYLFAMRALRQGRYGEAGGIATAFQTLIGNMYPGARTYLYLVSAASFVAGAQLERAKEQFMKAWELKERHGVVAPFAELNYALLGLQRYCLVDLSIDEYRCMDALVRPFHDGWYGLRSRCGLSVRTEPLTPLECYISGLVVLGWRNREIAGYLRISENTVKHQLSSIYQKLNLKSRADLSNVFGL